jgi:large subunit ribosomal protein L24
MHVKKDDTVIVIAGNDKGKVGQVVTVLRERGRVIVSGVNLRWKHKKATQQQPKGERIQEECSIHHSTVMLYDAEKKKGVRKRTAESAR